MDVQKKLDDIVAAVEGARSMPMSASCVVNRAELLAMLEEVRSALPDSLAHAQAVLGDRQQVVEEARQEAERIIASAHAERGSLVSDTQVARQSQDEADRILSEARREADEIRGEADDYVDSKLANFEVVLTKTIGAVDRGREKLLGHGPGVDEHGYPDAEIPERSHDPETLRRQADEYVDTKLVSFEAVLAKTLEAVGRGRLKLLGRRASDDLADYAAAAEQAGGGGFAQTDSEYVAALAGQVAGAGQFAGTGHTPVQPAAASVSDGYAAQPSGYAYDGYAAPAADAYGYPQDGYQDPQALQQPQQPHYPQDDGSYAAQQAAYDPSYGWQQAPQGQYDQQPAAQHAGASLDETSFFDTSLIDVERLRELDGGR